jgi:hypothetical protein
MKIFKNLVNLLVINFQPRDLIMMNMHLILVDISKQI